MDAEKPGEGTEAEHPGEVPDELDPDARADEDADIASSPPQETAAPDQTNPGPTPMPADEGLGTVPVGRTATPRRTADSAAPSAAKPAPTEDERG